MPKLVSLLVALGASLLMSPVAAPSSPSDEDAIRDALARWTDDFNAGRADAVCDLFAKDLVARFRGAPERDHAAQCAALRRVLSDRTHSYHNALEIAEVLVFGDVAIARVVWTETVRDTATGKETRTVEPGLDVFRRDPDRRWRIFRYLAFDE